MQTGTRRLAARGRRYFLCAGGVRAWLEIVVIQILFIILMMIFAPRATENVTATANMNLLAFFLFVQGWFALRWRLWTSASTLWHQLLLEIEMSGILLLDFILVCVLFRFVLPTSVIAVGRAVFFFALGTGICFFLFRCALYLLAFWNQLRQTRLLWALTHAHLMVVVVGAGVLAGLGSTVMMISAGEQLFHSLLALVIFAFIMLPSTALALVMVLPPSILVSFFVARRLTGRIERLARATGALRGGEYTVRVMVEGKDEIAHLQEDFNAMAADLERTMRELKEERDNVAMLLQARRELIASVSHELRTPVATVRSYLESTRVAWDSGQPPQTLKHDLQLMEQQTIRLQSLINDLFTLSRAEVGRLEMRCVPVDVTLLTQRVVDTMAPMAWRGSRVEILAEIKPLQPFPQALVDEQRLEQIFYNLLHNGIRHTPPGGIIVVSVDADEQQVVFQVKDTGEGIAADELEKIWERFYRAENTRLQPGTGTGLGLAIVRELTESMGGSVAVESVVSKGTCFTIRVPRVPKLPDDMNNDQRKMYHEYIEQMKTNPLSLE